MMNIILSTATAIGILVMIFCVLVGLSVLFLWIVGRFFNKPIKDKYTKKKDVHYMYCDEDGIKWGDARW